MSDSYWLCCFSCGQSGLHELVGGAAGKVCVCPNCGFTRWPPETLEVRDDAETETHET